MTEVAYPQSVAQMIPPSEGAPWQSTYRPSVPWPGLFGYAEDLDTYEYWLATAHAWRHPAWTEGAAFTGPVSFAGATTFNAAATFNQVTTFNKGVYSTQTQNVSSGLDAPGELPLYINENITGTYPVGGGSAYANWIICRDTADFRNAPDRSGSALNISHNLNAGFGGGRTSLRVGLTVQGSTINTLPSDNQWGAAFFNAASAINMGGTSTSDPTLTAGAIYGIYPQAYLLSGATNWYGIVGGEVDIGVQAGASIYHKRGFYVATLALDGVQGVGDDYAFGVTTLGSSVGWTNGYSVGSTGGTAGLTIATTGALFGITTMQNGSASGPKFALQQSKYGFNISEWVATDSSFLSPGFRVDGDGAVYIGGGKISYSGTQLLVDNPGRIVTAAAVSASSGTNGGNRVGDRFYDQLYHGIYEAATISGSGAVLTFNIVKPGFTTSGVPATTVDLIGGSGGSQGVKADITWAASTGIYVGSAGGFSRFGSGTWTANGAVAVSLTAVAPTGASATVQEWFTVRNASNVVRYIPAF